MTPVDHAAAARSRPRRGGAWLNCGVIATTNAKEDTQNVAVGDRVTITFGGRGSNGPSLENLTIGALSRTFG